MIIDEVTTTPPIDASGMRQEIRVDTYHKVDVYHHTADEQTVNKQNKLRANHLVHLSVCKEILIKQKQE